MGEESTSVPDLIQGEWVTREIYLAGGRLNPSESLAVTRHSAHGFRQCVHCASRDTRVTRENVVCRGCGMQTERDCNAAGNTVLKVLARSDDRAVAALRAHNREVTVRRGSVLGTWCAVARESLGLIERALASWGRQHRMRELGTPGSVGAAGGQPPAATRPIAQNGGQHALDIT